MTAGVCQYCACTEAQACEGGCAWADDARTVCTQCAWPAEVSAMFAAVIERTTGAAAAIRWADRDLQQRRALVMAGKHVLVLLRDNFLASIGEPAAAAAVDVARLAQFLQQRYPDAVAQAAQAGEASPIDVAMDLLGHKRIVLVTG